MSLVGVWRMIIPGGRDRKYKEPGVEECLAGFRVKSEVSERSELVFKIRERTRFLGQELANGKLIGQILGRHRRAESSYSTFKVSRGSSEEILLIQGKEQQLCFAGAAMKRYPTSKVRETQVRR